MQWIDRFQLFLFDFDGLLVDTERLHYQAYLDATAARGYFLDWDFWTFCQMAHLDGEALKVRLCAQFPDLALDWNQFYSEKKQRYLELINKGQVRLMPGVDALLRALEKAGIRRCTVTHSSREQTLPIRSQIPILETIPNWVTREDYKKPKPHPECYLKAIELYSQPGDRIIGFEDSIRGLTALRGTPALPVLICPSSHPLLSPEIRANVLHFESFLNIHLPPSLAGEKKGG